MKEALKALGFNSKFISKLESLKEATEISEDDIEALNTLKTEYIETDVKPSLSLPNEDSIRTDERNKNYAATIKSLKAHAKRSGVDASRLEEASKAQEIITMAVEAAKKAAGDSSNQDVVKLRADLEAAQNDLFDMKDAKEAAEAARVAALADKDNFAVSFKAEYAQKEKIRQAIFSADNFTPADNVAKETIDFQRGQIQQYIETNVGEVKDDGTILGKDGNILKSPSGKEVWSNLNEAIKGYVQVAGIGKVVNTRVAGDGDVIISAGDGDSKKSFNMTETAATLEAQMMAKFGE